MARDRGPGCGSGGASRRREGGRGRGCSPRNPLAQASGRLSVGSLLLLLLLLLLSWPALARPYRVFGYAPEDWPGDTLAFSSAQAQVANLDGVIYFGYRIDGQGNLEGWDSERLLKWARDNGKQILVAVHNFRQGSFDSSAVDTLLRSPAARRRAVSNLLSLLRRGYSGVNLDLENVPSADRNLWSDFVAEVAAALKSEGYLVTAAVPAKTFDDPWNGWSYPFDYQALGRVLDYVVIMAYDEHWAGGSPGPVASLPWVEQVVRYARSTIPAEKILLGLPAYGYDWYPGGADYLSFAQAEARARRYGASIQWDARAQVPYYRYWDAYGRQHTVYYENASSMAGKVDLVTSFGLGGVAIWRLGFEDPACWEGVIYGKLKWNDRAASGSGSASSTAGATGNPAAPAASGASTGTNISAPAVGAAKSSTGSPSSSTTGASTNTAASASGSSADTASPAGTASAPASATGAAGATPATAASAPASASTTAATPGAAAGPASSGSASPPVATGASGTAPAAASGSPGTNAAGTTASVSDAAGTASASADDTPGAPVSDAAASAASTGGTAASPSGAPAQSAGQASPSPGAWILDGPAGVVIIILAPSRFKEILLFILRSLGFSL